MIDKNKSIETERMFIDTEEEKLIVGSLSQFKLFIEEIRRSIVDKINVTN